MSLLATWILWLTFRTEQVSDDPWKVLVAVTLLNVTYGKTAIPVFWEIIGKYPTPQSLCSGESFSYAIPSAEIPTACYVDPAASEFLQCLLRPLGLQTKRSKRLIDLSSAYVEDPPSVTHLRESRGRVSISSASPTSPPNTPSSSRTKISRYPATAISHLPGTGPYALDSYRIFCTPSEWKEVIPSDKELIKYVVSGIHFHVLDHVFSTCKQKWKWAFTERMKWSPEEGVGGPVDIEYLENLLGEHNKI